MRGSRPFMEELEEATLEEVLAERAELGTTPFWETERARSYPAAAVTEEGL